MINNVYQPKEDSYLLQKQIPKHARGKVLDLGTGSGIQALTAAKSKAVKEVLAVDISKKTIENLKKKIKKEKLKKIKAIKSDLFSNIKGTFDLIIFNPPYLPQDKDSDGKKIKDKAIYGGKKGWELSGKFFRQVSEYLAPDGKILFLCSSLTKQRKIKQIIQENMFAGKEIAKQNLSFEELCVYLVQKTPLLRELEKKGIKKIHYFTHGKRGDIFTGIYQNRKVAIKVKRKESQAGGKIENEAKWLKILNKKGIGPKYLFHRENYLVYRFVDGGYILDWVRKKDKKSIKKLLTNILKQCFTLDKMKINKEEMHHPLKHIIVDKRQQPILLDFERTHQTDKPQNVTQFVEFTGRMRRELKEKKIFLDSEKMRGLAKEYKESFLEDCLEKIIKVISR